MIIKDVYAVFGDNLPATRSAYGAVVKKPCSVLAITKQFKNWKAFVLEYNKYAITQRNLAPKTVQKVTKNVTKK